MNTKEAIQAMLDGKKVRATNWEEGYYIQFSENDGFIDESLAMIDVIPEDNWEIYKEPKQKETVTFEKWLVKSNFDFSFQYIIETDKIDNLCYSCNCEKVQLLGTYKVEL